MDGVSFDAVDDVSAARPGFQVEVEVGGAVGVHAGDAVEEAAFGADEGDAAVVVGECLSEGFGGGVVDEEPSVGGVGEGGEVGDDVVLVDAIVFVVVFGEFVFGVFQLFFEDASSTVVELFLFSGFGDGLLFVVFEWFEDQIFGGGFAG